MISDACEYIMSHGKGELSEQMGKCQSPNIKMGRLYWIIQMDLIKSQGSSNVTEDGGRVSVRVVQWEQVQPLLALKMQGHRADGKEYR